MEEKRGILSHFSGVVRLILFIILIIALLFLVFRWVGNRRAEKRAQEVVQTTKSKDEKAEDKSQPSDNGQDVGVVEVPSGVADSNISKPSTTPTQGTTKVPTVGMKEDLLITTGFICFIVFLLVKNRNLVNKLKQAS